MYIVDNMVFYNGISTNLNVGTRAWVVQDPLHEFGWIVDECSLISIKARFDSNFFSKFE